MSALWTNEGINEAAKQFLGKTPFDDLILRLFKNNHTPDVTDDFSDYTECTLTGYAAITLNPATWTGAAGAGIAVYDYSALLFTFAAYVGSQTIYGYYLCTTSDVVVLADLITPAFVVPNGGGSVSITPTYVDRKF